MVENAPTKIVGDADIERAVLPAGKDVDIILAHHLAIAETAQSVIPGAAKGGARNPLQGVVRVEKWTPGSPFRVAPK
jgi:hypothetical protein